MSRYSLYCSKLFCAQKEELNFSIRVSCFSRLQKWKASVHVHNQLRLSHTSSHAHSALNDLIPTRLLKGALPIHESDFSKI